MAHFARTRATLGAWAIGTPVTDVELDGIDGKTFAALNGDGGGVWAPAAAVEIGGAGVKLTGANHVVDGVTAVLEFANQATLNIGDNAAASLATVWNTSELRIENGGSLAVRPSGTLTVQATGTLAIASGAVVTNASANWAITGTSKYTFATGTEIETQNGAILDVQAGTTFTIGATADFNGNASFDAATTFNTAAGTTTFNGPTVINGTPNLAVRMAMTGTARIPASWNWNAVDGNTNLGIADGTHLIYPSGVFSAPALLTLSVAGVADGDTLMVTNLDATHSLTVDGALVLQAASGFHMSARYVYRAAAGGWLPIERHPFDA